MIAKTNLEQVDWNNYESQVKAPFIEKRPFNIFRGNCTKLQKTSLKKLQTKRSPLSDGMMIAIGRNRTIEKFQDDLSWENYDYAN